MIDTIIEVNKYYHLEFQGLWESFTNDYYIAGASTPDTLTLIDPKISIYKTYFEDLGLGNNDYERYISPSTNVLIVNKVTSKNPISKDEELVYIPITLLNLPKCYTYLDAFKLNITIHSGVKHFDKLVDRKNFIKKTLVDIKDTVNKMDDYIGESISVDCEETDTITTRAILDDIESTRKYLKENVNKSRIQKQLILEASERNLYESTARMNEEKERYTAIANELLTKINNINAIKESNEYESAALNGVKTIMIRME